MSEKKADSVSVFGLPGARVRKFQKGAVSPVRSRIVICIRQKLMRGSCYEVTQRESAAHWQRAQEDPLGLVVGDVVCVSQ